MARFANLLMLLLIAFAATGLGKLWHEQIAHSAHERAMHSTSVADLHDDPAPVDHGHHHAAHSDCEVCILLSGMTTVLLAITAMLMIGTAANRSLQIVTQLLIRHPLLPAVPSRGPPSLA